MTNSDLQLTGRYPSLRKGHFTSFPEIDFFAKNLEIQKFCTQSDSRKFGKNSTPE